MRNPNNRDDLLDLAKIAKFAYNENDQNYKNNTTYWKTEKSCNVFVTKMNKEVIVCFRGTESDSWEDFNKDADVDLKFWSIKHECPKGMGGTCKIHKGFHDAVMNEIIWDHINNNLSNLVSEGDEVIFTGHSKGGAEVGW